MTKWFCDRCKEELKEDDHKRLKFQDGPFTIEIIASVDATSKPGHICHKCVKELIARN